MAIELNNQINKTLEEMAQAIFKSWFVDFEPFKDGEFEESELGLIPKGWEVIELRDIVDTFNGYSYKGSDLNEESKDALFTIKNFQRDGGFKTDGFKGLQISERVKPFHYLHRFDLIVAHTDITQAADIIGNPILILSNGNYKNLIMSMDLVKVVSKKPKINNFILYMLLKDERFKAHAIGYSSGTTVLHLNKKAIPDYKVALPKDMDIIEKITVIFESIYKEVSRIYEENRIIKEIRDTLLPKLISGEIRVPVEEVV
jgi:type I restriction enzyme S subunit